VEPFWFAVFKLGFGKKKSLENQALFANTMCGDQSLNPKTRLGLLAVWLEFAGCNIVSPMWLEPFWLAMFKLGFGKKKEPGKPGSFCIHDVRGSEPQPRDIPRPPGSNASGNHADRG
ncbi:MAG: hypothetical protein FWG12_07975, partial [Holophagaceae bacterium]|nr:hypothetical protein [Holophagaceae bacterium]